MAKSKLGKKGISLLYEKDSLKVRQLQEKDDILLAKWLSDPFVLEFYEGRDSPFDVQKVHQKFYNHKKDLVGCIVTYKGLDIGYIQYYHVNTKTSKIDSDDGTENVYGIDQFIGETAYWNKGIGTLLIKSMVAFLFEQKHADKVIMDPQVQNERAIKCYEKCGFKKIRMLPHHELHEGEYRDCWLMEYRKPI